MKVIIMGEKPIFSEIRRKEEITPNTYLLTDKEEQDIIESLEKGGNVVVAIFEKYQEVYKGRFDC